MLSTLPVWALVGRPNVGKSTLFNQMTRSRDALVADYAGLTRDRKYGRGELESRQFYVIDTGGIALGMELPLGVKPSQDPDRTVVKQLQRAVEQQAQAAMQEASVVLVVMDARDGVMSADVDLLQMARQTGKTIILVVNKVDGLNEDVLRAEFSALGVQNTQFTAASHGKGVGKLLERCFSLVPAQVDASGHCQQTDEPTAPELGYPCKPEGQGVRFAICGRPNVGKSTLTNRLLGDERMVVSELPGTTRDSVFISYEHHQKAYTLIDTAGVRKRGKVTETVEKFSVIKTLAAMDSADVVLLIIDAREPFVDQDLHLMSAALDFQKPLIIVVNKWDGLSEEQKKQAKRQMDRRLRFLEGVPIEFISALHGTGIGHLYRKINDCHRGYNIKPSTALLNRILAQALQAHSPPLINGRRIKLKYVNFGGNRPPCLVFFGNQTQKLPMAYRRYLQKSFQQALGLVGIPLRMQFNDAHNPFSGRKNKLTDRQVRRRKRLMTHVKNKKRR